MNIGIVFNLTEKKILRTLAKARLLYHLFEHTGIRPNYVMMTLEWAECKTNDGKLTK